MFIIVISRGKKMVYVRGKIGGFKIMSLILASRIIASL